MKSWIRNLFITLAIFFCLHQANATTVFPIATNFNLFEINSGIAFDGTNYLVGMEAGTNIVGQLVSSNGSLLGPQIIVGSNPGDPPLEMALAFGQTNYLLAWSDNSVTTGVDMFGQFISQSGTKVGSKFNLLQTQGSHGFQYVTALASDGTNFLVVWGDSYYSETEGYGDFFGQLVTPAGTLSGSEFLISSQQQNGNSAGAAFGKTNYLVVWQSNNGDIGNMNLTYGAFVSRSGSVSSVIQIGQTPTPDGGTAAVTFDGTNYLVAWDWDPYPATERAVTNSNIYGRLVAPTGTFPGSELHLVTDPGNDEIPSLAFDGVNYLLMWSYGFDLITNTNIRFQFFNRTGSAVGPEFTMFTAQGTNAPLLSLNGLAFAGTRYAVAATLGTVTNDNTGNIAGFPSGEVYGGFIPSSSTPPTLTASNLAGIHFPLQLTGTPGINYAIQMSTNLSPANWTAIVTNSPTNGTFSFTDTSATNKSRFYRAAMQ